MGGSQDVLVLAIPFDLRPCCPPNAKPHKRLVPSAQIPPANPRIHRDSRDQLGVTGVPVDICDGTSVRIDTPVKTSLRS